MGRRALPLEPAVRDVGTLVHANVEVGEVIVREDRPWALDPSYHRTDITFTDDEVSSVGGEFTTLPRVLRPPLFDVSYTRESDVFRFRFRLTSPAVDVVCELESYRPQPEEDGRWLMADRLTWRSDGILAAGDHHVVMVGHPDCRDFMFNVFVRS